MRWASISTAILLAAMAAGAAHAQDDGFCADRPGLGTPTCTLDRGQAMIEAAVVGWERAVETDRTIDTLTAADTLLRYGIGGKTELRLGLTGFLRETSRDRVTGLADRADGIGDSYLALRHDFGGVAVQPYVTLPTGADEVSEDTWGAGFVVPVDLATVGGIELALTTQIAAQPNESGDGRHLLYGAVLGGSGELASGLSGGLEIAGFQDDEPTVEAFESSLVATLAWQANPRLQFDIEVDVLLTGPGPRTAVLAGFAWQL